jgi:hypothetical protein
MFDQILTTAFVSGPVTPNPTPASWCPNLPSPSTASLSALEPAKLAKRLLKSSFFTPVPTASFSSEYFIKF